MKKKSKFLEEQVDYFDGDNTTKSILANRVDEIGLGYEQVKVEPEMLFPNYNYLGEVDKFAAYKNETEGREYIASPSISASEKEVSSFYLGGTFVVNTCENMLTIDPRTKPAEPEEVEEIVEELQLSVMIENLEESCIIPLDQVDGWGDTNVEDWPAPVDPNVKVEEGEDPVYIAGKWIVQNNGVVYDAKTQKASLVIQFVPDNLEDYSKITIDLSPEVSDEPPPDLLTKLSNHCSFTNNWLGSSYWNLKNEVTNRDSWHGRGQYGEKACPVENEGFFGKCLYFQSENTYADGGEFNVVTTQTYNTLFATDFSMAVWVKITREKSEASNFIPIASLPIIDWDSNFKNLNLQTGISGDLKTVKVGVYKNSNNFSYISGEEIPDNIENQWFFFVITYELETSKLVAYVNNKKVIEVSNGFSNHDGNNGSIRLGGIYQSSSNDMSKWFSGYMDELAIWQDKILTKKEMAMLYNNGNALPYDEYV